MSLSAASIARRPISRARGVGLGVYAFDEATLAAQKLAETDEIGTPMCVRITQDRPQS
ncbi:hypothetical protein LB565_13225 [Mesorhizobium sp. CA14]|uniref:hypothetical protein n=1 Tax=Mesorhizobium sp. CA14 TaxID=2876642 RepID=UPI001CCC04FB|nr:hypothetical protein [Mesorhizobium sp. CA14]MBZ9848941.1 hypothetical protein [Mesorhizobium sp. CA14]